MLGIKQNTGLVGQGWVFLKSLPLFPPSFLSTHVPEDQFDANKDPSLGWGQEGNCIQ